MNKRERVARAIYEMDRVGVRSWEDAPVATREDCFACADAAIAAYEAEEPSEAEVEAVATAFRDGTIGRERDAVWSSDRALARAALRAARKARM